MQNPIPSQITHVKTMAKGVRIYVDTQETVTPEQRKQLFDLYETVGHFFFFKSDKQMLVDTDISGDLPEATASGSPSRVHAVAGPPAMPPRCPPTSGSAAPSRRGGPPVPSPPPWSPAPAAAPATCSSGRPCASPVITVIVERYGPRILRAVERSAQQRQRRRSRR
jgi:hypothetical protein